MAAHHWAEIVLQTLGRETALLGRRGKLRAAAYPIGAVGRPQRLPVADALVGNLLDMMTEAVEQLCHGADALHHLGIGRGLSSPHSGRQADCEPPGVAFDRLEIGAGRLSHRDEAAAIGYPGQIIVSRRGVANRAGDDAVNGDPRYVFTLRQWPWHAAPRRLEPDETAKRGGDAGGSAAVGGHADRHYPGGNGRRRATRGAARGPLRIPRAARHLEPAEIVGRRVEGHAEFGCRRPADRNQSGPEIVVDKGISRRDHMVLVQL